MRLVALDLLVFTAAYMKFACIFVVAYNIYHLCVYSLYFLCCKYIFLIVFAAVVMKFECIFVVVYNIFVFIYCVAHCTFIFCFYFASCESEGFV